ncbi:hypothetical protein MKX08_005519 [Trichoderma sp. CBMAI-0020]|nr:hypothetical protein MKX08_005519 [Trichoderma sp. CBMAI-0020]
MGSSKPKTVPSNLAGTTCEARPRTRPSPRHWNHEEHSDKTVQPESTPQSWLAQPPIHGVKSRLLEVPQFPDARSKNLLATALLGNPQLVAVFRSQFPAQQRNRRPLHETDRSSRGEAKLTTSYLSQRTRPTEVDETRRQLQSGRRNAV